jgi:hypothetical protein
MFAILAAASVLAVEQLDDRETVVPPPDAVAEQFTRSVMAKRWEPARQYLQSPDALSEDELEAMQKELGEGEDVEAELVSRDQNRALVTVRLPSRGVVKNFALTFDREWKIDVP